MKGKAPLKTNIQKIFKGASLSALIFMILLSTLSPTAFAASTSTVWAEVIVSRLNCRSAPSLSADIVHEFHAGDKFQVTGETAEKYDGYIWFECEFGWVANTGGLRFYDATTYTDNISAYDIYGQLSWEHECSRPTSTFEYQFEVFDDGYTVRCACGWWLNVDCPSFMVGDGSSVEDTLIFLGLDTNNDEVIDLRPGDTKVVKRKYADNLRDLQIWEFYGPENYDVPSVTLDFYNEDGSLFKSIEFQWGAYVYVDNSCIIFEDLYGNKQTVFIDYEFLVYDELNKSFLSDVPRYFTFPGDEDGMLRHFTWEFSISKVGSKAWGPVGLFYYLCRQLTDPVADLFDFFGLTEIFTDPDSPFVFLFNLPSGVSSVFSVIGEFFDALPSEIIVLISLPFVGFLILAVWRWLR